MALYQLENKLDRKQQQDHPETRLDVTARYLHHAPRSDGRPDNDRDRTAEDQGKVKTAARQVPEHAEQGREDHNKTHDTGRIFRRVAAEEYQERHDKDPAPDPEKAGDDADKKTKTHDEGVHPFGKC